MQKTTDLTTKPHLKGRAWRCRACRAELGRIVEIRYPINTELRMVKKRPRQRSLRRGRKLVADPAALDMLTLYPDGRLTGRCAQCGGKVGYRGLNKV